MKKLFQRLFLRAKPVKLPEILVKKTARYDRTITSPAPDFRGDIFNSEGARIGFASYALSPLNDCLYVYDLRIEPGFMRQDYGLATLQYFANTYGKPIIPVHELESAEGFWDVVRRRIVAVEVREQISVSDLDKECQRWAFLKPDSDRLQEQIIARLMRGEPWEEAVGRGLDE